MTRFTLCLLAMLTLGLVGCGAGPGDRVKEFTYAMEEGDTETVKEICPGMAALLPGEKLDGMVKEASIDAKAKGGIESITIDEETINGDSATVKATVTWGNGDSETDEVKMAKVDGEWIMSMEDEDKESGNNMDVDMDIDMDTDVDVPQIPEGE